MGVRPPSLLGGDFFSKLLPPPTLTHPSHHHSPHPPSAPAIICGNVGRFNMDLQNFLLFVGISACTMKGRHYLRFNLLSTFRGREEDRERSYWKSAGLVFFSLGFMCFM
ncbi:hypothetical protein CHARACLAT_009913 [Characodon lateralis]|uniref:Uncharacterized protein n=1 Tax=Characodon lateralis TaxID=208331 RepID=A0ABU7DHF9_9TELE|nr:hypothetical protein [Characodon lateralis]